MPARLPREFTNIRFSLEEYLPPHAAEEFPYPKKYVFDTPEEFETALAAEKKKYPFRHEYIGVVNPYNNREILSSQDYYEYLREDLFCRRCRDLLGEYYGACAQYADNRIKRMQSTFSAGNLEAQKSDREKIMSLTREITSLREQLTISTSECDDLDCALHISTKLCVEYKNKVDSLTQELESLKLNFQCVRYEISRLERENASLKNKKNSFFPWLIIFVSLLLALVGWLC